ncbi:hypothetical protein Emed_007575 [Eimeria media]
MENPGDAQRSPMAQTESVDAAVRSSAFLQHEESHAAAAGEEDQYSEAKGATAIRPSSSRRPLLGALAAVALALVLAAVASKRLLFVEAALLTVQTADVAFLSTQEPPLIKAPKYVKKVPPVVVQKPEAPKEPEEQGGPAEVEKTVNNIVEWAKQTRTDENLSGFAARKIELMQQLIRNGVEYQIKCRFNSLTPAYDAEKTAAQLAEGVRRLLEECLPLEEEARTTSKVPWVMEDFGDRGTGSVNVMISRESLFALWRCGPPVGALLPKCRSHCSSPNSRR